MKYLAGTLPSAVNLVTRPELDDEEDESDMSFLHECWWMTDKGLEAAEATGPFPGKMFTSRLSEKC